MTKYDERRLMHALFYDELRSYCPDIHAARLWVNTWANQMGQVVPGWGMFSFRAMTAHVSRALDGAADGGSVVDTFLTAYYDETHGSDLYFAICGSGIQRYLPVPVEGEK